MWMTKTSDTNIEMFSSPTSSPTSQDRSHRNFVHRLNRISSNQNFVMVTYFWCQKYTRYRSEWTSVLVSLNLPQFQVSYQPNPNPNKFFILDMAFQRKETWNKNLRDSVASIINTQFVVNKLLLVIFILVTWPSLQQSRQYNGTSNKDWKIFPNLRSGKHFRKSVPEIRSRKYFLYFGHDSYKN